MPIEYSPTSVGLKPYRLTEFDFLHIGRLIAGCAELEDLIDLYFCELTGISEAYSLILFGRTSAAAKVKMAETIAKAKGGNLWAVHKECFLHQGFLDIVKCRNTVAHGVLMGMTDNGEIAFQVKEVGRADETEVSILVLGYAPSLIKDLADGIWKSLPNVEGRLQLKALREKRRKPTLDPHHKAQFRATKGEEPLPPPQS